MDTTTDSLTDSTQVILDWFSNNSQVFLSVVFIIVCATVATKVVANIFSRLLGRTVRQDMYPTKTDRDRRLSTITSISTAVISFIVWTVAVLMILNQLGINTGPLLASAGIVGVALGFGAQSLVKDFMTGMFIIAENQYRVGDYVEIQNVKGRVKAVTMRTTIVVDDDGTVFHIPNGSIIVTGNHTMGNTEVVIELSFPTGTEIDEVQKVIDKVGKLQASHKDMEDKITSPLHFVRVRDITAGAIIVKISGKVNPGRQAAVRSNFYTLLLKEFTKQKIELK